MRLLVRAFGTLQGSAERPARDLQSVDGIGAMWARHVRGVVTAGGIDHQRSIIILPARVFSVRPLTWSGYWPGRRRRLIDERNRQRAQTAQVVPRDWVPLIAGRVRQRRHSIPVQVTAVVTLPHRG